MIPDHEFRRSVLIMRNKPETPQRLCRNRKLDPTFCPRHQPLVPVQEVAEC